MRRYRQFCPVAKASELFCQRWTPILIRDLASGPLRFSDLQRGAPLMSPTLLSRRLRELVAEGIIERRTPKGERSARYALTESGQELVPLVVGLGTWGRRWTRRELERDEVDLGLFLWAFERSVRPEAFPDERTVVELSLTDQPKAKRRWWFVNECGAVDLCVDDPGFEVDLFVSATLPDLIRVWRGDVELSAALHDERIELSGARRLRSAFRLWFGVSTLAHVEPARRDRR